MNRIFFVLFMTLTCLAASQQDNYNGPSEEDVVVLDGSNL